MYIKCIPCVYKVRLFVCYLGSRSRVRTIIAQRKGQWASYPPCDARHFRLTEIITSLAFSQTAIPATDWWMCLSHRFNARQFTSSVGKPSSLPLLPFALLLLHTYVYGTYTSGWNGRVSIAQVLNVHDALSAAIARARWGCQCGVSPIMCTIIQCCMARRLPLAAQFHPTAFGHYHSLSLSLSVSISFSFSRLAPRSDRVFPLLVVSSIREPRFASGRKESR